MIAVGTATYPLVGRRFWQPQGLPANSRFQITPQKSKLNEPNFLIINSTYNTFSQMRPHEKNSLFLPFLKTFFKTQNLNKTDRTCFTANGK